MFASSFQDVVCLQMSPWIKNRHRVGATGTSEVKWLFSGTSKIPFVSVALWSLCGMLACNWVQCQQEEWARDPLKKRQSFRAGRREGMSSALVFARRPEWPYLMAMPGSSVSACDVPIPVFWKKSQIFCSGHWEPADVALKPACHFPVVWWCCLQ